MRKKKLLAITVLSFVITSISVTSSNIENNKHENLETRIQPEKSVRNIDEPEPIKFKSIIEEEFVVNEQEPIVEEPIVEEPIVEEPIVEEPIVEEPEVGYIEINVLVSFYTDGEEENGEGYSGKNAIGGRLSNTSIAIPRNDDLVRYGTKLEFERLSDGYMNDYNGQYLTRIADDCGSPKHIRVREDGVYRMDVYCPRFEGEEDEPYRDRVNSYGKYETQCKVYIE